VRTRIFVFVALDHVTHQVNFKCFWRS